MTADPRMDQYLAHVDEIIGRVGWAVQGVLPTVDDPGSSLPFAYTVGLWTSECHLDLLMIGLDPSTAQDILNQLGTRIKAGETFQHGQTCSDVLQPTSGGTAMPVKMLEVPQFAWREWFGTALRYYREKHARGFGFLQVVWPDKAGLFPWQSGFDGALRARQPVIGAP